MAGVGKSHGGGLSGGRIRETSQKLIMTVLDTVIFFGRGKEDTRVDPRVRPGGAHDENEEPHSRERGHEVSFGGERYFRCRWGVEAGHQLRLAGAHFRQVLVFHIAETTDLFG